jgi:hypothetical protein
VSQMAKASKKLPPDDPEQSAAFIKKAREIEADEERSRADDLLRRLSKMKPEPRQSKAAAKK